MSKPKDAEAIDGFKFRTTEMPDGFWTDPFATHDFWSRTFMPKGTDYEEATDETEMIVKIKAKAKVKFKETDLSKETKEKMEKDVDLKDKVDKEPKEPKEATAK